MAKQEFRLKESEFDKALERSPVRGWVALVARATHRTWGALEAEQRITLHERLSFRSVLDATTLLSGPADLLELSPGFNDTLTECANQVEERFGQSSRQSVLASNFWSLLDVISEFAAVVEHRAERGSTIQNRFADTVMKRVNGAIFLAGQYDNAEQMMPECGKDLQRLGAQPEEDSPALAYVDASELGPLGSLWTGEPPTWS